MSWEKLIEASSRFSGFSLEKRAEWGPAVRWRARIIPNKATRQDYRITAYGATPEEALTKLLEARDLVDANNKSLSDLQRAADAVRAERDRELTTRLNNGV